MSRQTEDELLRSLSNTKDFSVYRTLPSVFVEDLKEGELHIFDLATTHPSKSRKCSFKSHVAQSWITLSEEDILAYQGAKKDYFDPATATRQLELNVVHERYLRASKQMDSGLAEVLGKWERTFAVNLKPFTHSKFGHMFSLGSHPANTVYFSSARFRQTMTLNEEWSAPSPLGRHIIESKMNVQCFDTEEDWMWIGYVSPYPMLTWTYYPKHKQVHVSMREPSALVRTDPRHDLKVTVSDLGGSLSYQVSVTAGFAIPNPELGVLVKEAHMC